MKKYIILGVAVLAAVILYTFLWLAGGKTEMAQRVAITDKEQKVKVNKFIEEAIKVYNKNNDEKFKELWAKVPEEQYEFNLKNLGKPPLATPYLEKLTRPKLGMGELYAYVRFPGEEGNIQFVLDDMDESLLIKGIYPALKKK